jgi:hypothetical protein
LQIAVFYGDGFRDRQDLPTREEADERNQFVVVERLLTKVAVTRNNLKSTSHLLFDRYDRRDDVLIRRSFQTSD